MGLFDKKFCDICGEKIGLLGNRKLQDGNLCKDCARQLSPWMTDRRQSTVEEIRQHLAYREENRARLSSFHPNVVLGNGTKVYIDTNQGIFAVTSGDYHAVNADLVSISQVTSCDCEIEEHRREIYMKDKEGKNVSYNPPCYDYDYEFTMHIRVNAPYFDEIDFELSNSTRRPDSRFDAMYHDLERQAYEIRCALMPAAAGGFAQPGYGQQPMYGQPAYGQPAYGQQPVQQVYQQPVQQAAAGPKFCPNCGGAMDGTTKFCPNCGAQVQ